MTPEGSLGRNTGARRTHPRSRSLLQLENAGGLAGYEHPWCPIPLVKPAHCLQDIVGDSGHESLAVNLPQPSQMGTGPTQPVKRSEGSLHRGLAALHFPLEVRCLIAFPGPEVEGVVHAQRHVPALLIGRKTLGFDRDRSDNRVAWLRTGRFHPGGGKHCVAAVCPAGKSDGHLGRRTRPLATMLDSWFGWIGM